MNQKNKANMLQRKAEALNFSGVYYIKNNHIFLKDAFGYSNKTDYIRNKTNTIFPISSGCKIFTAVAICMLVDQNRLSFTTRLQTILNIDFPNFDSEVTIHHLLTHTSGISDYFDEESDDDFENLWREYPVYLMRSPSDFLPLFQNQNMRSALGTEFHYNNAGYILLGLVVEAVSEMSFTDFVEKNIFKAAGMVHSGYYSVDSLPENTALGYIKLPSGRWRNNIYTIPVKGGADGGAYTTVEDRARFWEMLMNGSLLSKHVLDEFLSSQVPVDLGDNIYYGYCGYMEAQEGKQPIKFIQMGYDPGINFREVYYPEDCRHIIVCSNEEENAYELLQEIEDCC